MRAEERRERLAGQRVVVDDEDPGSHSRPLSAGTHLPTRGRWKRDGRTENQSWLWGEILLAGLLGASLALFLAYPGLRTHYDLPELRLVLQTTMAARRPARRRARGGPLLGRGPPRRPAPRERLLRHRRSRRAVFAIGPRFGGRDLSPAEAWAALIGAILGQALIAIAPFSRGRSKYREWSIANAVAAAGITLFVAWSLLRALGAGAARPQPADGQPQPFYLTGTLALQAFVCLVASSAGARASCAAATTSRAGSRSASR